MQPVRLVTYLLLCLLLVSCDYCTRYQEAHVTIAIADSLDQNEHTLFEDTVALLQAIRTLDNPFGRLFAHNQLGKAHYYMGRNLSLNDQITQAAEHYIAADRAQIDDPNLSRAYQFLLRSYQQTKRERQPRPYLLRTCQWRLP